MKRYYEDTLFSTHTSMKKLLLIPFSIFTITLFAQPLCQWAYIPVALTQSYNTIYNAAVDHNGNIVEAGIILGSADMDPGSAASDTSFTGVSYNYYISKTSGDGHLIWIRYFRNATQISFCECMGLKINSDNEIIVVGNFFGSVDFDLSDNGVDTLRSHFQTYPDYFIAKYDSTGNYQWAVNIGDPSTSNIEVQAVTILPNNNIVIVSNPNGIVDVDPSATVHNSIGGNANLICYDSNGSYVWNNHIATTYSYGVNNNSIDCDSAGNTLVASVGYYELTMTKFDNTGAVVWEKTIGDFSAQARVNPQSILAEKVTGDFYVAGTFGGTVDFDPNVTVANRTSSSGFYQDGFIAKYDRHMDLLWVVTYPGDLSFGKYSLDFSGTDIVAVGSLTGTIDFGNGVVLSGAASLSPFYLKISQGGIAQNGFVLSGIGLYNSINSFPNQTFVTTGGISTSTDMDPSARVLVLNITASNYFTAVYESTPATTVSAINSNKEFDAYPNPAIDYFYLNTFNEKSECTYIIYDALGKKVMTGILESGNTRINIGNLVSGVYTLSIIGAFPQSIRLMKD